MPTTVHCNVCILLITTTKKTVWFKCRIHLIPQSASVWWLKSRTRQIDAREQLSAFRDCAEKLKKCRWNPCRVDRQPPSDYYSFEIFLFFSVHICLTAIFSYGSTWHQYLACHSRWNNKIRNGNNQYQHNTHNIQTKQNFVVFRSIRSHVCSGACGQSFFSTKSSSRFFLSIHTPFEIKPTYFIFHYILMHNIYIFIFVVYFRIGPTRSVKSRSDCVAHRFQFLERSSINIIVLFCCSSSSSGAAGASVNVGKREIEVLGLGKTKANWPHRLQRKQKTHIHWCIVVHTCTN